MVPRREGSAPFSPVKSQRPCYVVWSLTFYWRYPDQKETIDDVTIEEHFNGSSKCIPKSLSQSVNLSELYIIIEDLLVIIDLPFIDLYQILLLIIRREWGKRANLKTGVSRKQSAPKFPKNNYFLPPDTHTHVYVSGGKKCLFFRNFGVLCFLETPVLRFALLPYYRWIGELKQIK